jgi:preprotein translocase subunit SecG
MLIYLLTTVHVIVCIFLIVVVLLQSGKAADLAGAFGGMGSQTAFGPRGSATLLSRATTLSAVLFMITSLSLSIFATRTAGVSRTVLDSSGAKQTGPAKSGTAPVKPVKPAGAPSVTVTPSGGGSGKTIPLQVPPAGQGQKAPVNPAAPKK